MNNKKNKLEIVINKIKEWLKENSENFYSNEMRLENLNNELYWYSKDRDNYLEIMNENSFKVCLPENVFKKMNINEIESEIEFQYEISWEDDPYANEISVRDYKYNIEKTLDELLKIDFIKYFSWI